MGQTAIWPFCPHSFLVIQRLTCVLHFPTGGGGGFFFQIGVNKLLSSRVLDKPVLHAFVSPPLPCYTEV